MIIRSEDIKDICSSLKSAVDTEGVSNVANAMEIKANGGKLEFNLTNLEYFVNVSIDSGATDEFNATVVADVFLNLIPQITTETIELSLADNYLVVVGNGEYKIPLVYDNTIMLSLPTISADVVSTQFNISKSILDNISTYNKKEIGNGVISHPVQKMFYVDKEGCITFTSGACVTSFTLPSDVKFLLTSKVVNLFKLFNDDAVEFSLGHSEVNGLNRDIVSFKDSKSCVSCYLNGDDSLMNAVPVQAIRDRASDVYDHSVVVNRNDLMTSINRLMVFNSKDAISRPYYSFTFDNDSVTIKDSKSDNTEQIMYVNEVDTLDNGYTATLDLLDIKNVLESHKFEDITINFGNSQAIVVKQSGVANVIPECII